VEIPLLKDIIVIFGLAVVVLFVCHRLRIPAIVGFLVTGIVAGPHGFGLIGAVEEVEILAEIGVALLLFTIGIEFSLKSLLQIKKSLLLGGSAQVLLTIVVGFAIARKLSIDVGGAVFIGFLVSLSSTAIVPKILQEKAEIESYHGRLALAILIFQDLAVVPMMLLVPILAGATGQLEGSLLLLAAKVIGVIGFVVVSTKWIVSQVLYQVARTRNRELFLLCILVMCFGVALFTYRLGLSLALGAFLAGLIISESEYGHHTLSNIVPFRDVFTSLFFVSIGMLLNLRVLIDEPSRLAVAVVVVIALKSIVTCFVVLLLGFPLRIGILAGLALCQIGEFSFVLSIVGIEYGLLADDVYQLFLAVAVVTMGLTPFVSSLAPRVANAALRLPIPHKLREGFSPLRETTGGPRFRDHLIILGFGLNGRNVAQAAKVAGIPHVVLEMNPETVQREKAAGVPIYYGDATQEAVLDHVCVGDARVIVVAVSDPVATRRIISVARRLNPKAHIIVRTRLLHEMPALLELGANEVIPEEFETSVEIFARVLTKYLVPKDEIERFAAEVRAGGYQMLRSFSREATQLGNLELHLPDVEVSTIGVSDGSPFVGRSLAEIEPRKKYGVTILAIRRGSEILSNPDSTTTVLVGDVLIVLGSPASIATIAGLLRAPETRTAAE
jgi:CPA2 family monovalent cation:H+ antiporter-2